MLCNSEHRVGRLAMVLEMRLHAADDFEGLFDVPVTDVRLCGGLQPVEKILEGRQSSPWVLVDHCETPANSGMPLNVVHDAPDTRAI
jgi:hypothetical protein